MDLGQIRTEIDAIDKEILRLFVRRMQVVEEVARIKKESGQPVLDPAREKKIIDWAAEEAGEWGEPACVLFQTLMDLSRARQQSLREASEK